MNNKELLKIAEDARKYAYVPYSDFRVEAALFKAISEGESEV